MAYCPSCGKQNPDDARYCNNCGADLTTGARGSRRRDEDRCNEECSGRGRGGLLFWGLIVVLVGIGIIVSAVSNYLPNPPSWLVDFNWWWLVLVVVGAAVLVAGVRMLIRAGKNQ